MKAARTRRRSAASMLRACVPMLLALLACRPPPPQPPPQPVVHHDASCLPASPTISPELARARTEQLIRLIKATEETNPLMPELIERLATASFEGGNVKRGCAVVEVLGRFGPEMVARSIQLRAEHCLDDRVVRCDAWYEPR